MIISHLIHARIQDEINVPSGLLSGKNKFLCAYPRGYGINPNTNNEYGSFSSSAV